ncbi:6-pyruvoyl trahydropterin synthase family protein [Mycobacterium decipiens]|nr:6-carboxytetrahydropterin synthase [Mycobacterium decipiens]
MRSDVVAAERDNPNTAAEPSRAVSKGLVPTIRTIEKTFRFDAGHRSLGFDYTKEETIHGHTWELKLIVECRQKLDDMKTIFDTNELNVITRPIIDSLDHSFIIWTEDPIFDAFVKVCELAGVADKVYPVDFNPTIEGMVEHIFNRVDEQLELDGCTLKRAELRCASTLNACYEVG